MRTSLMLLILSIRAIAMPMASADPIRIFSYEVRGIGNTTNLEDFAAYADETYRDPRGWSLGGSIAFVRIPVGGDFTLWLAAPEHMRNFGPICDAEWSCRVGRNVIINEQRFLTGSAAWNATGSLLRDYQHMIVNHETGHWLDFRHAPCLGPGQLAPIMQQQSKTMLDCLPNAWPTDVERAMLAQRTM